MTPVDELPIGTVTFLFTDIEGSTQLLKQLRDRWGDALADHQRILRDAFAEHGGYEIDTQGDSFFVAFRRAKDAIGAAISCQNRLASHSWPDGVELRVRMGIHTGEPAVGGERYLGLGVHRAARICAAGHGGQVLVSQTTRELLRDDPLHGVSLRDLGEHQLKDMDEPERLYQLVAAGLGDDFPDIKTAAVAPFEGREGELAEAAAEELSRRWRRPRRRLLIAATFAVAVVGAVLGVLLRHSGGSTAGASIAANAVGVIDPDNSKIAGEIPVGVAPAGIAGNTDAIWVSNTGENTVSRIDPQTNDLRGTVHVGGGPAGVAITRNAVWVANGLDGTVSRIDPETNGVSQTITVGNGPSGVASGEKAVWVSNSADGTVSRIDPVSGAVTRTFPATVGAAGIAVGFGRVWVVSPPAGKVVALDPQSGEILKEIGVGVDPTAVATGADAIWVANRADGTVSKIDPRTDAVTATIPVGRGPAGIAAGPNTIWVTNAGDGTLSRFDPARVGEVRSISMDNPPGGIAMLPHGVYVAVGSSGKEHRGGKLAVLAPPLDTIDPAFAYTGTSWSILTMTNDGLVGFRRVGGVQGIQLVPDLASALPTPSNGGKTYTFQLRPAIRYSNGKLVQPDDFRGALERVFQLGSPGAQYFNGLVGADHCAKGKRCDLAHGIVTDRVGRTVSMNLTAPDADFLTKLALPFASAVPAKTPAHDVGTRAVAATGPYRIAEYRKKTQTVRLVRNPYFHQWSADAQPQGYPDSITVSSRFGFLNAPRVGAVRSGAADVARGGGVPMSKHELDVLSERYPSQLHISTQFISRFFFLNTRIPPFNDVRVRRAVNDAFDRDSFAVRQGRAFAATCQILPPNFPGYRPNCPYTSGGVAGVDRARRLVRNAGAAGTSIIVWVPAPQAENGRYMVSVLNSLGFRAHVHIVPNNAGGTDTYFRAIGDSRSRVQIGFSAWGADFPSPTGFIPPLVSCRAFIPASPDLTSNLSGFCDPALDAEMASAVALQAQDPPAATLLWQQIESQILAQAPILPTVNERNVDFVSKRVGGYQYNPQWGVLLDQLWVR